MRKVIDGKPNYLHMEVLHAHSDEGIERLYASILDF